MTVASGVQAAGCGESAGGGIEKFGGGESAGSESTSDKDHSVFEDGDSEVDAFLQRASGFRECSGGWMVEFGRAGSAEGSVTIHHENEAAV